MTQCYIDADVIAYQISACGQHIEKDGSISIHDFDSVVEMADNLIREIEEGCLADEPSILFFTGDEKLVNYSNRLADVRGNERMVFEPNYRHSIAVTRPYKGQRIQEKPYHFNNLRLYLLSEYDCRISRGMEADDLICIELGKNPNAIACSRDKDLRMVPGWHFTWACGKQEQEGPTLVTPLGHIRLNDKGALKGDGAKFFWAQMIMGDTIDNIPGVPKAGPKKAYELLAHLETEDECREAVINLYKEKGLTREYFQEQKALLWIMREEDEVGQTERGVVQV